MNEIMVNKLTSMAMTDTAGLKLREEIEKLIKTEEKIIIDFTGITLFATMFFNASIGHFVMTLSPEKCNDLFKFVNLTELGMETYKHSFENAEAIFHDRKQQSVIGEITQNNIEHS